MQKLRTIVGHICVASLVLLVGEGPARADIVQEAVDRVSLGQYRIYQIDIQDMGLGLYGGPEYDQGYRNRDGWAYGVAKYKTTWTQGGTPGNLETRLYLADQLAAMGLEVTVGGTYRNVVAELRGTQRPEDIYIVSAHYDTTSTGERPGGDDNASGTAGVLEAARVLSQYDSAATLRFIAFNAEEDWMLGSQEYVDTVVVAGKENVVGVLNLDMILRPGWDSNPDAAVDLDIETGSSQACMDWAYTFIDAIAAYVPTLTVDAAAPDWEYWDAGDQGPFIEAGHPALMIAENTAIEIWSRGSHAYYHKAGDASDAAANDPCSPSGVTYDYNFAADVVRAAVATLAQEAGITAKSAPAFIESQSLPTKGAQDIEPFAIGDDSYIAIANGRNDLTYDVNTVVCKWDGDDFVAVQSIPSHGAADCEFFAMGGDRYLAIANMRDDATHAVESKLYHWDGAGFVPFQSFATEGAADCEFFAIGDGRYLAIANSRTDATAAASSVVYRWNGTAFELFQLLPTYGARDCEFFSIGEEFFLAIANERTDATPNVNSQIYRWDGTRFSEFQAVATQGAADWTFFTIGTDSYLAVANGGDGSYAADSRVYKWDGTGFAAYQILPTQGAADCEFYTVGGESFLAVANSRDDATSEVASTVYQWNGTRFVEALSIPTHGASDLAFFTIDDASFLAAANSGDDAIREVASTIYRYDLSPAETPAE